MLSSDEELNESEISKMIKYSKDDVSADNDELPVVFEKILFKQNYMPGSSDSLKFH